MNKLLASLSVFLSVLSGQLSFMSDPPTRPRWSLEANCSRHVRLFRVPACPPARLPDRRKERERERMMPRTFPIVLYPAACPGAKKPISIKTSRLRTHSGRERAQRRQPTRPPAIIGFGAFGLRSDGVTHPSSPSFLPFFSLRPFSRLGKTDGNEAEEVLGVN